MLDNPEWQRLGARVMHRFAAEEQTPDGFWGEHSDGWHYDLLFVVMCLVIATTAGGRYVLWGGGLPGQ